MPELLSPLGGDEAVEKEVESRQPHGRCGKWHALVCARCIDMDTRRPLSGRQLFLVGVDNEASEVWVLVVSEQHRYKDGLEVTP
jgi:hypothetical protein